MSAKKRTHAEYLQSAFADFEKASNELGTFYQSLERRVAALTNALCEARSAEVKQLREKQHIAARLRGLLDALPAGVVELGGDGCIVEFNPAAANLLPDISVGDKWVDIVKRAFKPRWDDGHDISLSDGRRVNIETAALGTTPGQILLIKDVTETRHLQELLSHHRRLSAKTEVAAGLAHQVRTPLSTAILHLSNARIKNPCTDGTDPASKALTSMRDIERLVEDMLTFARAGQFELAPIDVVDLMAGLADASTPGAATSGIEINFDDKSDGAKIRGNFDALISVMLNLIENSSAAGASKLRITASAAAETLRIDFEDDGPGIALDKKPHIFEPFFSTKQSSNGLGLAVARSVSRAHNGELIYNDDCAVGASFSLVLPRLECIEADPIHNLSHHRSLEETA